MRSIFVHKQKETSAAYTSAYIANTKYNIKFHNFANSVRGGENTMRKEIDEVLLYIECGVYLM